MTFPLEQIESVPFALVGESVHVKVKLTPNETSKKHGIIVRGGFLEGGALPSLSLLPEGNEGGENHCLYED